MSGSGSAAAPDPNGETDRQGGARPPSGRQAAGAAQPPPGDAQPPDQTAGRQPPSDQPAGPPPRPDAAQPRSSQDRPPAADPNADFLITSADRDAAEARLRQAVADEVVSLDEFGDRMRTLLGARTRGELQQAVAGLPGAAEPRQRTRERGTARPAREQEYIVAVMSESATRGRWRPARQTTAVAVMGNAVVDLQGAEYEGDELKINALAWMGGVEIVVPEGVEVELSGFAVMGDRTMKVDDGPYLPDAPLVRVDAYAVMGSVEVRHPKPKERRAISGDRGAFADRVPLHGERAPEAAQRRRRSGAGETVRRWAGGLLAAAALALPLGWVLSSDDVAGTVFGSTDHVVNTQVLEAGEELTVGAPVAFGSVAIQVPEGVNVARDGVVIFGSTECTACGAVADSDAPTVTVRTLGGFGSVEIHRVGSPALD